MGLRCNDIRRHYPAQHAIHGQLLLPLVPSSALAVVVGLRSGGSAIIDCQRKLNDKLYSVSQNGDGIPREVGVDDNDLGNDVPMPSLVDYGKSSTQDPNLQLAKDYAKLYGHYDPENMDDINSLLYVMRTNPRVKADFEREVEWARSKNKGVAESTGDPQITPGMKTQYGTVVSVEGNTVTVKASNGELTTVNINDIDQAMAEGDVPTTPEPRDMSDFWKQARRNHYGAKRPVGEDVAEGDMDEGDNQSTFVEELDEAPYDGPYDKPIRFQPGDSQAYRDAMSQGRSIRIQNRADAAEKTLAQRAAEPKNIGQKIARDIGDPLKQLAKGDVKGALFDPPASLTNKVGSGSATSRMTGGGGMGGGAGLGGGSFKRPGDDRFNPLKLENAELTRMLQHAGVPLQEGVLTDSTGSTMDHIKDTFKRDIKDFSQSGEMSEHLFRRLYDYYFDDMPYGAKTGDDIDPYQWVSDRFAEDLGINENLIAPIIMPVSEGSCNMTMEGEYCPEHGLMECGGMYEDGGAVGMPYSMGEGVDDPINSNSAMTGSYYEGKETDIQEGDALLARIKSLALLR